MATCVANAAARPAATRRRRARAARAAPRAPGALRRDALAAGLLLVALPGARGARAEGEEASKAASKAAGGALKVLVAGATGSTGRLVVKELHEQGFDVVAGVRSTGKAAETGVDTLSNSLATIDVTNSPEDIASAIPAGVDAIICATGFVPGNPFKMGSAAHAVDNIGTQNLVKAAKLAGVKRFVLVSSILTNGRAIGQEKSPGFVITNAFGGVLDEKLEAEQVLRASGLDYTIVRPGGLKDEITDKVILAQEDTLFSGEVARANVAAVCVEALKSGASVSNKVVELVEYGTCINDSCPGAEGNPGSDDRSTWFSS